LDSAIRNLCQHPFCSEGDAHIGKDGRAYALPAVTHKRPFNLTTTPGRHAENRTAASAAYLMIDHCSVRGTFAARQRQLSGTLSLYETTSASSGTKGAGVGRARHPAGKDQAPRAARAPRPPSRSPSAVVSRLHLSAGRNGMVASALGAWHVWLDDGRCNTG